MTHEVETLWMGKMQFNSLVNDHTIVMDAPERVGGEDNGPIPKPLILTALSGCTGMDVVALLRKDGKVLSQLDIQASGELTKTAPYMYESIHLTYKMEGEESIKEAAIAVAQRSQNDICGVSAMLKKALPVTWEIWYNGKEYFSNKPVKIEMVLEN